MDSPFFASPPRRITRFDRRLATILEQATSIFSEKGYAGASMRDLSRVSGMSLAGLYYYFESKEKLLYLIQKNLFTSVFEQLQERLKDVSGAEDRMRVFILNHVEFFLSRPKAMKLLAQENEALASESVADIAELKLKYYRHGADLADALWRKKKLAGNSRTAVMSLFGTINSLHTWYDPGADPDPCTLAGEITGMFFQGLDFYRPRNGTKRGRHVARDLSAR